MRLAYNRRPMPKKTASQRDAERRAEARRRARLQAQGRMPEDELEEEADAPARAPALPLYQRLFPPTAPLPGKPDPMAGFSYTGRFRPLVANLWLIPRNPFAGIAMGILWAAAYVLTVQEAKSTIGTVASFLSFGSLVAAGWIGWQRPWLYGLVAAVLGYILYSGYFVYLVSTDPAAAAVVTTSQVTAYLLTNGIVQAGIGALAGFYGGYLRRRLADPANRQAAAARRRR
jgi:hypothetical protein